MWRIVRVTLLLAALVLVGSAAWFDRARASSWSDTLWIGVFPVDADGREATRRYLAGLQAADFGEIEAFFRREARAHGVALERPVHVELYPPVADAPPRLASGSSALATLWWSLRLRWYSWRAARGTLASVRMFVLYHDPDVTAAVPHSLGLQKGLVGVVYGYAAQDMHAQNEVVIAHEVLHTLGATDKYDPATLAPLYPQGYGEPQREPRHPQRLAEIMAGRIALSPTDASMPESLAETVVGPETAAEIHWSTHR